MEYAVVTVAAAPVRRKAGHRQEMVNQLLFGETVKVLKARDDLWVKVRALHDNYEGWMTRTQLEETGEKTAGTRNLFASAELLYPGMIGDQPIHLAAGSSLPFFENGTGKIGIRDYRFAGKFVKRDEQVPSPTLVKELTASWVNAPYLWGGRTVLGVDCSGFVQVIYKLMGIDLARDAWQQAQEGNRVKKFSEARPGDLAFFDNREDIVHVGILLDNQQIIHASGKVRIDTLDKKGIINADTGKRTLRLRALRRLW